jgi:hypothetical protein
MIVLVVDSVVVAEHHHEVYVFRARIERVAKRVYNSDFVIGLDQNLLEVTEVNRRVVLKNESSLAH